MGIDEVSRTWTRLGAEDPMWAVLTDREKAGGGWTTDDFLATGAQEIETLLARLDALDVAPTRGRATLVLQKAADHSVRRLRLRKI